MDPFPLQWRLYNHNIRNSNLWSIKYNVYADRHRHITKKTTYSSYVYYDCRGATVGDRGSMAWMRAYIAVSNLRIMISMEISRTFRESAPGYTGNTARLNIPKHMNNTSIVLHVNGFPGIVWAILAGLD
jgi:hypothetical protein